jgi:uncharacterized protein YhfF
LVLNEQRSEQIFGLYSRNHGYLLLSLYGSPLIHVKEYTKVEEKGKYMADEVRRIQFVSDNLVEQIVTGQKTASVVNLHEADVDEDEYNNALVVGKYYDVDDSLLKKRCTIRIVAMELCRWDAIPERLWRGETNSNADEFREDHLDYFTNPKDDFEFISYYFELG